MFTGLIQAIGKVVEYDGKTLRLQTPFRRLARGESINIDGVCLTVVSGSGAHAAFEVGPETARVTTLGRAQPGTRFNLERALRFGDRLGGHWVSGHVEATARILSIERAGRHWWFTISLPRALRKFVIPKGSIAVDGISLTVAKLKTSSMTLMIIPHTFSHTTLGRKRQGDAVNLETDLLAKYAFKNRSGRRPATPF
jgi:riboflavin synthase